MGLTKLDHKDEGDEERRDLPFDCHANQLGDGLPVNILLLSAVAGEDNIGKSENGKRWTEDIPCRSFPSRS